MPKKEDVILECFVIKGKGIDFLGVIYQENEVDLKALLRKCFSDNRIFLEFYTGENQQRLSDRLSETAHRLADRYGLCPVHLVYPGGIGESQFIKGLREAKRQMEMNRHIIRN
jgi:hypothetical protein